MYENYNGYENDNVIQVETGLNSYIVKVFAWMFIGLIATAISSYGLFRTGLFMLFMNMPALIVLAIAEIGLVVYLTSAVAKNSISTLGAKIGFIIYAVINGITLSSIFIAYDIGLIYQAFLISALTFGIMAFFGKVTNKDLTKFGSILLMGLIGVILATLVNMILSFFGLFSTKLDIVLSYLTIFIFLGLTAFDVQKIKRFYYSSQGDMALASNLSILGALTLYLDFINIFIKVLRLLGRNRR